MQPTDLDRVAFPKSGRAHPPVASLAEPVQISKQRGRKDACEVPAGTPYQERTGSGVRMVGNEPVTRRLGRQEEKSAFCVSEVMEVSTIDSIAYGVDDKRWNRWQSMEVMLDGGSLAGIVPDSQLQAKM